MKLNGSWDKRSERRKPERWRYPERDGNPWSHLDDPTAVIESATVEDASNALSDLSHLRLLEQHPQLAYEPLREICDFGITRQFGCAQPYGPIDSCLSFLFSATDRAPQLPERTRHCNLRSHSLR
jgi:hypothetical protein